MGAVTVKADADGALVVPRETLEALGVQGGGKLRLTAEDAPERTEAIGPTRWPSCGRSPDLAAARPGVPWRSCCLNVGSKRPLKSSTFRKPDASVRL